MQVAHATRARPTLPPETCDAVWAVGAAAPIAARPVRPTFCSATFWIRRVLVRAQEGQYGKAGSASSSRYQPFRIRTLVTSGHKVHDQSHGQVMGGAFKTISDTEAAGPDCLGDSWNLRPAQRGRWLAAWCRDWSSSPSLISAPQYAGAHSPLRVRTRGYALTSSNRCTRQRDGDAVSNASSWNAKAAGRPPDAPPLLQTTLVVCL